jgi:D-xylose transport system substrate-binding protein
MKFMSRRRAAALSAVLIAAAATLVALTATAGAARRASAEACVLLPDTKSSVRWELFDRPYLTKAFKAAGVTSLILNAQGDAQRQRSQLDQCLTNGAKVVLLTNLDPGSGLAITKAAQAKGAKVIDYDRLVVGSGASYYVSFDNVKVGRLEGLGIVAGLKANGMYSQHPVVAELNGAPTDNNAKLFKQGYDSVYAPLYKNGTFKKGPDQWVPQWDNQKALTIFEQMLAQTGNKIDAVNSANDGLGNAVVSALKNHGLKPIPVSGQDATPQGVQNILAGWQSGTVYKSVRLEANAAAKAAIAVVKGQSVTTNGKVSGTPSILETPVWITKKNYTLLFKEGFVKKSQICVGAYAKYCK